mmetsp:Transcript_34117/g.85882  ORF Transcript_34117/g.85882 Transcript_34117/m.85882 type:complete len:285 (-) Transcript_34117:146-1000(-)
MSTLSSPLASLNIAALRRTASRCPSVRATTRCTAASDSESSKQQQLQLRQQQPPAPVVVSRRGLGAAALAAGVAAAGLDLANPQPAAAVMGMTAGRVPGLAAADANGIRRYTRPEGKSGGHGVGWTEITPYSFDVYEGWTEVPVSIADPGGSEIDVRFNSEDMGGLKVVLAPALRFVDIKQGTNPGIEELVPFERFMSGFGPELTQNPVDDTEIVDRFKDTRDGLTYYNFELKNHTLVAATAYRKRIFIICLTAPSRQWRNNSDKLRAVMKSFKVNALDDVFVP